MHHVLINRYGGTHGLRDPGALEAALFRPQSGYYEDTIQQAAALWESLNNNHPFLDGNKRVAFAVTDVFLNLNGYKITAPPANIWTVIDDLLTNGQFEFTKLDTWLRQNTKQLTTGK